MAEAAQTDQTPPRPGTTSYLEEPEDIVRALKSMRDQRATMQLRFEGLEDTFTARILDVAANEFLLEDIRPRNGREHFKTGATFTMSGRVAGLYLLSEINRITAADAERGIPYFHVELPKSVIYQQRRRSTRYPVPPRVATSGARVILFRNLKPRGEPEALPGRIIDISAGGCRAEFDGPVHPPLEVDEVLSSCAISIPKLLEFTSKGTIRHFALNKRDRRLTCGIELTEMHVTDRRRLEQFIQTIAGVKS